MASKSLVIVESPAKVHTIKKFLGTGYEVDASQGHVRDLPKSSLGIDVENDFEPRYITIRGKGEVLARLRKEVKKADKIYLATDPDREGEAISWHLMKALKLEDTDKKVYRIAFNEITKNAVKESLKNPRELDYDLIDAQQARRVLDRMVGYMISPLLWAKVKRGLSAGRVQSVALRMICDREAEIDAFIPQEYWNLDALLNSNGSKKLMTAKFYGTTSKKMSIDGRSDCEKIMKDLAEATYEVSEVKHGERIKNAPIPFTTSTMQQEASKVLNYSTQKTMRIAQQLYEDGRITYLRTDSTRIAEEADVAARSYIATTYGDSYVSAKASAKKGSTKIQDAHEAIRPTDITQTPVKMKEVLQKDAFRLYQLIWKRFTASRMKAAVYDTTSVKVKADKYIFTMAGSKLSFDGFMGVYVDEDGKEESSAAIAKLNVGDKLKLKELKDSQHFTQPPSHYTEASLVKALEEQGIGRPSTYAPTITTILGRRYIVKEQKNLYVTEIGKVVDDIMVREFPTIVDETFTANMEALLDSIGDGKTKWKTVIENFYPDLNNSVIKAEKELESVKIADEETDVICENCGRHMVIKYGPHGKFLACPGFPDCKNTKPYLEKIGVPCPKCGKEVVIRKTRKGRMYYGCENNPDCDFMSWNKPSTVKCPKCGEYMVEKGNKLLCSSKTCGYSENIKQN